MDWRHLSFARKVGAVARAGIFAKLSLPVYCDLDRFVANCLEASGLYYERPRNGFTDTGRLVVPADVRAALFTKAWYLNSLE
jgi:hypothetical protein